MSTRVQVVFAAVDGSMPAGQKLPMAGRTLVNAAARTGAKVEKVIPMQVQPVNALLVLGDLNNPERLASLAMHGAQRMKLKTGDELVMLPAQVEALGLDAAVGYTSEAGVQLVCGGPLFQIFQLS